MDRIEAVSEWQHNDAAYYSKRWLGPVEDLLRASY